MNNKKHQEKEKFKSKPTSQDDYGRDEFKCEPCDLTFTNSNAYDLHNKLAHNGG